jgi:tetratricopeptide (TPR) repeat protein
MKKVSLAGILVLTFVVSYFVLSKQDEVVVITKPKVAISNSRKLFLGARKKVDQASTKKLTIVADGCEVVTLQLEDIDFNLPVTEWVERLDLNTFDKCQQPEFKDRIASIKTNCFNKLDEQSCAQQAIFFRSLLRTRGVTDADDQDLLADMVISEFADSTPDFHKLENYSEKLMNLDPNQASYQKLWASSKVIANLMDKKSPTALSETLAERIDENVWNSSDMQGLKMAVATGLKPDSVEEYARGFLSKKDDTRMHEVLGWSLWRQNRFAEAVQELERAIALNPTDKWLKEQLNKVTSKDANLETYQARISLGIDLQDLYN